MGLLAGALEAQPRSFFVGEAVAVHDVHRLSLITRNRWPPDVVFLDDFQLSLQVAKSVWYIGCLKDLLEKMACRPGLSKLKVPGGGPMQKGENG